MRQERPVRVVGFLDSPVERYETVCLDETWIMCRLE